MRLYEIRLGRPYNSAAKKGKQEGELQMRDGGKGEEAPLSRSGFWHPSVFTAHSEVLPTFL